MNISLAYERQIPAEKKFEEYDFSDLERHGSSIVEKGIWEVAARASHPHRTLMRTLKIDWNNRIYYRVFCVVFKPDSTEVEEVLFGDMLP